MQEQNRVVVPTQLFDVYRSCNQTGEKMFRDTLNEQQLQALTNFTKVFDCGNLKFEWNRNEQ